MLVTRDGVGASRRIADHSWWMQECTYVQLVQVLRSILAELRAGHKCLLQSHAAQGGPDGCQRSQSQVTSSRARLIQFAGAPPVLRTDRALKEFAKSGFIKRTSCIDFVPKHAAFCMFRASSSQWRIPRTVSCGPPNGGANFAGTLGSSPQSSIIACTEASAERALFWFTRSPLSSA